MARITFNRWLTRQAHRRDHVDHVGDLAGDWQLDARELALLERAGRCADELAKLEKAIDKDGITIAGSKNQRRIHPAVGEARQARLVLLRLLSAIEVTDPKASIRAATPAQKRARDAANTRWRLEREAG